MASMFGGDQADVRIVTDCRILKISKGINGSSLAWINSVGIRICWQELIGRLGGVVVVSGSEPKERRSDAVIEFINGLAVSRAAAIS